MHHPLLEQLTDETRDALAPHIQRHLYVRGSLLFQQGDPVAGLYFIESGLGCALLDWSENTEE
ncbi:MAG TPA: cyclic nucleotide-binding domain-containing protein [Pseudomonadales bacterium]|nr:cyclic nucleotide-binding domain-containing protein [Pseudomonadales bacterium]